MFYAFRVEIFFVLVLVFSCRYMTGKLLLKLDTLTFIISNHTVILLQFFCVDIIMHSNLSPAVTQYASCLIPEGAVSILRRVQMLSKQNNILLHYWLADFHGG